VLYFYKDHNSEWVFLSEKGYNEGKGNLPALVGATKHWIYDFESIKWPSEFELGEMLGDEE
jgi:hypothetical protein